MLLLIASPSPSTGLVICTLLSDLRFGKLQASVVQDVSSEAMFYPGATFENKEEEKKKNGTSSVMVGGWRKVALGGGAKSWVRVLSRVTKLLVD